MSFNQVVNKEAPSNSNKKYKLPHYPSKVGINMNIHERYAKKVLILSVGFVLMIALASAVAKFGVIDQFERLYTAQDEYEEIHKQYLAAKESLKDYDIILNEYRTYSTDWMNTGLGGENDALFSAVERRKVLTMVEEIMMPKGNVHSIGMQNNVVTIRMSGMPLDEISEMIDELLLVPIVNGVKLNTASTENDGGASLSFLLTITLKEEAQS